MQTIPALRLISYRPPFHLIHVYSHCQICGWPPVSANEALVPPRDGQSMTPTGRHNHRITSLPLPLPLPFVSLPLLLHIMYSFSTISAARHQRRPKASCLTQSREKYSVSPTSTAICSFPPLLRSTSLCTLFLSTISVTTYPSPSRSFPPNNYSTNNSI